jgi:hypothetical protein
MTLRLNQLTPKTPKIRRYLPILLGGFLILGLGSCRFLSPNKQESIATLKDYYIDLQWPNNWVTTHQGIDSPLLLNSRDVITLSPVKDGKLEKNVTLKVILESLPEEMELEEFYKKIALRKLETYGTEKLGQYGNRIESTQSITLSEDQPAYQIVYSRSDGEKNTKAMIIMTLRGKQDNLIYVIHYVAEENQYQTFLADAKSIAKSLKLLAIR